MKLNELCTALKGLEGVKVFDFQDVDITGLAYDSRRVRPGHVFVALQGSKTDGHDYVMEAVKSGAVAIVTEKAVNISMAQGGISSGFPQIVVPSSRKALACLASYFYGEPSRRLTYIGVTGTNGKTTICYLIRSILEASGKKVGLIGTVTCVTGRRCIPSSHTTPEALELHGLFREMIDSGVTHVVMEVSSHALVQDRVHGIDFKAAIFTNLSQEHLDYHKDMDAYREAKALLFQSLSPESFAVLNAEDPSSQYLAKRTKAQVLWYYPGASKGIRGEVLGTALDGTEVALRDEEQEVLVRYPLIGSHNFRNLLAAVTTAKALGVELPFIKRGIDSMQCPPGRLDRIEGKGFSVFVDYAHTPHALESVLETVKPLVENRLLLVFGCGGDRDRGKRPLMGQVAERYCDLFWLTSDNPRSEHPREIIREIERGISGKSYRVEPDRRLAIEQAINEAVEGDVVLIAGKGHEQTQDLGRLVIPFDDKEVVEQALSRKTNKRKQPVEELQTVALSAGRA